MRNFKFILEYDGTDFIGWQRQLTGRSVQRVVEEALADIVGGEVDVIGAGRTDSGVHARRQTANAKMETTLPPEKLLRALNAVLPSDVLVHSLSEVPFEFSARYHALSKLYRYYLSRGRSPLNRRYCWEIFYRLDVALMNDCAAMLSGLTDYESFCKSEAEVKTYCCHITEAAWLEQGEKQLLFSIRADRFLHGMVRALVGTMIEVGRGYRSVDEFRKIFDARDRTRAGMSAPPQGLFLEEVYYPEDEG